MTKRALDDSKVIYSTRTYSYLDISGLCWYLFKNDDDVATIPSTRYISSVHGDKLNEYLNKTAVLIGDSKTVDMDKSNATGAMLRQLFQQDEEAASISVYTARKWSTIGEIKISSPIIFKLTIGEANVLSMSGFNSEELEKVYLYMIETYGKSPDFEKNTMFGILTNSGDSISVKQLPIDDKFSRELDVALNYGKAFESHHENIMSKIESNSNGLFLFHGSPGTGKTTYIKYLAKKFGGKKTFIFIPTTFIDSLTSPNIIPVLLEHPNSVLVLEDAEKAVISREDNHGNESLVSSLLNIGDGILGSMLNLTIILTFNTDREKVDKALLRKGRLHYEHAFEKLSIEDAQVLINKMNKAYNVTEPMSLAEIYNVDNDNNHVEKQKTKLGFGK